jgi:hypothetical protein
VGLLPPNHDDDSSSGADQRHSQSQMGGGARAANARIIAQLHQQVDFLSKELAGRDGEVKKLREREAAGGREACRALQVEGGGEGMYVGMCVLGGFVVWCVCLDIFGCVEVVAGGLTACSSLLSSYLPP